MLCVVCACFTGSGPVSLHKKKNCAVAIESLLLQTRPFKSRADGRLLVTGAIKEACTRFGGFFFFSFLDKPHQTVGGEGRVRRWRWGLNRWTGL